jgi:hypothetical protein
MAKRVTHRTVGDAVANKEPFVGPSSRGGAMQDVGHGTGYLPSEHAEAMRAQNPSYVVKSYNTPIAWHGDEGWIVPDVKYSRTTSRMQGNIRRRLDHFKSSIETHSGSTITGPMRQGIE